MSTAAPAIESESPASPRVSAWKNLRELLPYLSRYKKSIALGLLLLTAMGIVGALPPLVIGALTDCLVGAAAPLESVRGFLREWIGFLFPAYEPGSRHTLAIYVLVLLLIVALKGVLSFCTRWILIGISRDIEYDLRNDLLARLVELEPEFYVRNRTGELMSRCTNDLNAVRMVLGPGIMYTATTLVTMAMAIALMLELSPLLTLWVLLPVPIVVFAVRSFGQVIHRLSEKIQAALAALSAKVEENLAGVRVLRAYAQEDAEVRAFDELNRDYVSKNMRWIRSWSMFMPSLQALLGLTFLIVLWQGGRLVMQSRITLGELISFYSYLGVLTWPMIALGWVTNIFQRGAASMGRLNYILKAEPRIDDAEVSPEFRRVGAGGDGRGPLPACAEIRGDIEFRDLTFAYPAHSNGSAGAPVLNDIHLHVPAGTTLAIVGPTGSGKSTLAALMARLYEAPAGTLFLDGRPVRAWPLAALRRAIGFVPQDTFLFSETLRENIAFGVEATSEEAVAEAAQIASLWGEIQDFRNRFETIVGERGITLSGGQKQRTALARALIRDPRILILDDALSSVDTETEEKILHRLKDAIRGRTTVLISHRCSTVRHADEIIVLRAGRIVERGAHDDLLARGGYYADLYRKQLLEEELERA